MWCVAPTAIGSINNRFQSFFLKWSNDILLTFFYDAGGEGAWMFWCRDYGCGAGGQVA
jgi:hypothetical protein